MLGRSQSFVRRFRESAEAVCRELGVKVLLQTPLGSAFAVEAMQACLEKMWARRAPTALILVSWYEYLGAYGWLASRGLRVPQDVSLISLVGDATAPWMVPRPAHFEHDEAKLAESAGRLGAAAAGGGRRGGSPCPAGRPMGGGWLGWAGARDVSRGESP
jgi:DNA-binding LacI/PurR family transcriptional regulator